MEFKVNTQLLKKITNRFSKLDASESYPVDETTETSRATQYYRSIKMALEQTRRARYTDYRTMDDGYVEVSAALDLYADNAAKGIDEGGVPFEIKSDDGKVQGIIDELMDRTKLPDKTWHTLRNMAKMGDEFDEAVVRDDLIVKLKTLQQETIRMEVDDYGREKDKPYTQRSPSGGQLAEFERWQIIHWKNGGAKWLYGESVLKPIRRVYRQLEFMEDSLVLTQITGGPARYKFKINTVGMDYKTGEKHIKKIKEDYKRRRFINPTTNQFETTQNPIGPQEDIFLDQESDVDIIQGATNLTGMVRGIEHFWNKLFIGLKTPKILLGLEKDVGAKNLAVEQIIQFACGVGRLRSGFRNGLVKLCDRQLILSGVMPSKDLYWAEFAPMSTVDELRKWTIEKLKAEVVKVYKVDIGIPFTDEIMLRDYVGITDPDDIKAMLGQKKQPPTTQKPKGGNGEDTSAKRLSATTGLSVPGAPGVTVNKERQMDDPDGWQAAIFEIERQVGHLKNLSSLG